MREYVRECLQKHPPDQFPVEFVGCVFMHAKKESKHEHLVQESTKALVALSRQKGWEAFISLEEIEQRTGTITSPSGGLWVWLEPEANVVQKKRGRRAVRIRKEFRDAFLRLFDGNQDQPKSSSILRLQGLGKEVWAGIDAQAYVDRERSAWAGQRTYTARS